MLLEIPFCLTYFQFALNQLNNVSQTVKQMITQGQQVCSTIIQTKKNNWRKRKMQKQMYICVPHEQLIFNCFLSTSHPDVGRLIFI